MPSDARADHDNPRFPRVTVRPLGGSCRRPGLITAPLADPIEGGIPIDVSALAVDQPSGLRVRSRSGTNVLASCRKQSSGCNGRCADRVSTSRIAAATSWLTQVGIPPAHRAPDVVCAPAEVAPADTVARVPAYPAGVRPRRRSERARTHGVVVTFAPGIGITPAIGATAMIKAASSFGLSGRSPLGTVEHPGDIYTVDEVGRFRPDSAPQRITSALLGQGCRRAVLSGHPPARRRATMPLMSRPCAPAHPRRLAVRRHCPRRRRRSTRRPAGEHSAAAVAALSILRAPPVISTRAPFADGLPPAHRCADSPP